VLPQYGVENNDHTVLLIVNDVGDTEQGNRVSLKADNPLANPVKSEAQWPISSFRRKPGTQWILDTGFRRCDGGTIYGARCNCPTISSQSRSLHTPAKLMAS
jgi:hypothetical protein